MNFGIRLRLAWLGLASGLMGLLIVLVTLNSQKQAEDLRVRLAHVYSESFGIADHFKAALREVSDKMRAYRSSRDSRDWNDFLRASHELDLWVDQQAPGLTTEREKETLKEIDATYGTYLRAAEELHDKIQAAGPKDVSRTESGRYIEQSRRLADLGELLARAHFESRDEVMAHANRTLKELRLSVLGLLALLFVFGIALAVGVYRQMIAPLRVKLVESQALAEQNEKLAALGMLAAGVAHEIRNPLTAIKAALFIQQKRFLPGSAERADNQLVEREILRLEQIVHHFLQFARPSEPQLAVIAADWPLQEVQTLLAGPLAKTGIQLSCEPATPMQIKADLAQIKQVLINLVQNAADSIVPPGTITLRARADTMKLPASDSAEVVILEVSDSGKGITPEVEKRLFDPFFTTKDNGTGLGLSIAAQIVKHHGGALQFQTQVHYGTTFGIVLPRFIP